MMTTYHVTETCLVARIQRQGLRTLQPSNWTNAAGERLGGGAIHAFENETDAHRWAAKMDWDMHQQVGSGKISILTITSVCIQWDPDFNDILTRAAYRGQWLKCFQPVPPECIVGAQKFEAEHAKALCSAASKVY
jgi:hypothetical protein